MSGTAEGKGPFPIIVEMEKWILYKRREWHREYSAAEWQKIPYDVMGDKAMKRKQPKERFLEGGMHLNAHATIRTLLQSQKQIWQIKQGAVLEAQHLNASCSVRTPLQCQQHPTNSFQHANKETNCFGWAIKIPLVLPFSAHLAKFGIYIEHL
ncbi:unnamed protein product [Ilex paraguariensis]|uniref:Uncharacterized protein n=1 Tax=Ilex paraguariensis TaxID=185542 RepID=A0ABC8RDC7_9AQUA